MSSLAVWAKAVRPKPRTAIPMTNLMGCLMFLDRACAPPVSVAVRWESRPGIDGPGIGEARIANDFEIGEAFQKSGQISLVLLRRGNRAHVRIKRGTAADAASGGVVVDDFAQGGDTAIVHVGRGERDVAQRRRAEFRGRVVEAGVVELAVGEIGAVVAAEAARDGIAEENHFAALRGFGDR